MSPSAITTSLSAIIASLLSAFDSSRQLHRRIKGQKIQQQQQPKSKPKLNKRGKSVQWSPSASSPHVIVQAHAREDQLIHLHLQRAPQQIARTYEVNSGRLGDRYRHGDEQAKTSLNHTLLVLNTGLTKIISSLLGGSSDVHRIAIRSEARKSLLSLTEKSALDALTELEGLRIRLESMGSLPLTIQQNGSSTRQHRQRNHKQVGKEKGAVAVAAQSQRKRGTSTAGAASAKTGTQSRALQVTTAQGKSAAKGHKKKSVVNGSLDPREAPSSAKTTIDQKTAVTTTRHRSMTTGSTPITTSPPAAPAPATTVAGKKNKMKSQENYPLWVRSKNSSTIALEIRPTYKRGNSSGDSNTAKQASKPRQAAITAPVSAAAASSSSPNLVLPTPTRNAPSPHNHHHHHQEQIHHSLHHSPPNNPPYRHHHSPPPLTNPEPTYPPQFNLRNEDQIGKRLSIMSHSSGSTKLGEIPQHKWINPWIPPVEVEDEEGEEGGDMDGQGDGVDGNRPGGRVGLRFWRRFGRTSV